MKTAEELHLHYVLLLREGAADTHFSHTVWRVAYEVFRVILQLGDVLFDLTSPELDATIANRWIDSRCRISYTPLQSSCDPSALPAEVG